MSRYSSSPTSAFHVAGADSETTVISERKFQTLRLVKDQWCVEAKATSLRNIFSAFHPLNTLSSNRSQFPADTDLSEYANPIMNNDICGDRHH